MSIVAIVKDEIDKMIKKLEDDEQRATEERQREAGDKNVMVVLSMLGRGRGGANISG